MPTDIKAIIPPKISDKITRTFPERLGWAVTQLWDDLPKQVREEILQQAAFVETGPPTVQLSQQIEIFARKHAGRL